jgi:hypothetical protein
MERVVELSLQLPGKLGTVEVAGMDLKNIRVHGSGRVFEIDQNLDGASRLARGEAQKRVIVEAEMVEDLRQLSRVGHPITRPCAGAVFPVRGRHA